jgi:glycosyltransferase involved in cell wall biosynthesis
MRVLVISHPAVAPAYRRKFELIANDVELRLVVPNAWPEEARRVVAAGQSLPDWTIPLPVAFEGYYTRYFYRSGLAEVFRTFRPDLVHIEEEPYSLSAGQALWMTRRHARDARFIFRTSLSAEIRLKSVAVPFLRFIERQVFARSDCVFVLSERAAEVMRLHGYRGATRVFPNGVDTRVFRPLSDAERSETRRALGLGEGPVVGFVGRLISVKGIETLLEAVAALAETRGLIVGEGPHRVALEAYAAELGVSERVRFVGSQPPERVAGLLNAMDVFVLPSRTSPEWVEFFGRVAVEAMACGVPVVGSDSGEIPRTLGDAGLVFPEGDASALADCLTRILLDPALAATLRERGQERVSSLYAWEAVATRTVEAYRSVLSGDA